MPVSHPTHSTAQADEERDVERRGRPLEIVGRDRIVDAREMRSDEQTEAGGQ